MQEKTGTVTSTKMAKTLVVRVDEYKKHPKYSKLFRTSKKFYAHTENEKAFEEGQTVTIVEARPASKLKRWAVLGEKADQA